VPKRSWLGGGCAVALAVLAAVLLVVAAGFWFLGDTIRRQLAGPTPVSIAQASLEGLREQNRLSTFAARYVAVVTSRQSRLGLSAEKTMIMPGMVRYEVDLARLQQGDVRWDAATRRLSITLPPVEVVGPEIELGAIRQYDNGGILLSLTDVGGRLDEANRKAGQAELIRLARQATPMRLAREATRRAVERSFVMPLKAAGLDAQVEVRFPDERGPADRERWDVSRSVDDVLANRW
jgi:hypothetical protein